MQLVLSPQLQETLAVRGQLSDTAAEGTVRLRVGTVEDGRGPIWAEFKATFHRPLPPNGRITGAFLHRELRGQDYHWMLRLTITSEQDVPEPKNPGTRLATSVGENSTTETCGSLCLRAPSANSGTERGL